MYVKARVAPGAKKESVEKTDENSFAISVREPAERNMANTRVREIVAREYGVSPGAVRIVSGHRSRTKILSIRAEGV